MFQNSNVFGNLDDCVIERSHIMQIYSASVLCLSIE